MSVAMVTQNSNFQMCKPIWLNEIQHVANKIKKQEDVEVGNALKQIEPIFDNIYERYKNFVREQVQNTTLEWIETKYYLHPLQMDRTHLSETQWVNDEPTLTRLLASLMRKDSIFRGALFFYLFKDYLRPNKQNPFLGIDDFCINEETEISAITEIYGSEKEEEHQKKRRADIIVNLKLNNIQYQIFIEAKINSQRDNKQLNEMARQFQKNDNDENLWFFLSNEDDDENNKKDGIGVLPKQWTRISWCDVVTGLEKTLKYYQKQYENDYRYYWFKFLIGAMWQGTLGVVTDPSNSLFSLYTNAYFRTVVKNLKLEEA